MHVILCSASNSNFNFIIPSFRITKLSKAMPRAYTTCGQVDRNSVLCRNEATEG